ncbi:MAG: tRNA (N6-isopentenyl adenosine(37)-C2)-methylthiotransferase MiaB [Eubacterium sp.]|jgi:tRNA-2-methylthio-N6-dimethylallyladenosine synthase|nr:tRNA (N6-isopentenyl adenosine(37)-C2)-methylthiotransferase MiaB [Eubacterium sp.]
MSNSYSFEVINIKGKAYIRTYGCQQNFADSEKICGILTLLGYTIVYNDDDVDLMIFNTCAIRENAKDRIFGNIGALKHKKLKNPKLRIVICGCLTQQRDIAEKVKKTFPFVDLILGTNQLNSLPELLAGLFNGSKHGVILSDEDEPIAENLPVVRDSKYKANISIMYGCDNYCTYCIVPYVRGRERSRSAAKIMEEVKSFYYEGCREFLLLGQNVNSYGKGTDVNFNRLINYIDNIPGDFIINFMTSHPKDLTKELIDTIADSKKISYRLHLPVQSGSDRILEAMNRGYTRREYLELINYAKSRIPGLSLTTDIIVGFPGEDYADFSETISLMKEARFDSAYTFIYSKRPGTKAAELPDYVSEEQKSIWFRELLSVQSKIGEAALNGYVGQTLRIFCTGKGRSDEKLLTGKSRNGFIVDFPGNDEKIGSFVNIKIIRALNWALIGEEIK